MPLLLPVRPDLAHFEFTVTLDERVYLLEFRWNEREEAWYFDVKEEDGTRIRSGVKVVVDWPLGKRCRDERFPPGLFVALDTSGAGLDPGLEDLGDRVQVLYYEADELPLAEAV